MTFRRGLFHAAGWLAGGAFLLGTLRGVNALTSVACGVALASLLLGVKLARSLQSQELQRASRILSYAMIASIIALFGLTMGLGGGALNGRISEGSYYLREHGRETQVAAPTYYLVAGFEIYLFAIWPVGMTLGIRAQNYGEAAS